MAVAAPALHARGGGLIGRQRRDRIGRYADVPGVGDDEARKAAEAARIIGSIHTLDHHFNFNALIANTDEEQSAAQGVIMHSENPATGTSYARRAVEDYVRAGYVQMNSSLRDEGPAAMNVEDEIEDLDKLTTSEQGALSDDVILYRAAAARGPTNLLGRVDLKPGSIVSDRAFMSTSSHFAKAAWFKGNDEHSVMFRIHAREGTKGLSISGNALSDAQEEYEFLLPRDSRLLVVGLVRHTEMSTPMYDVVLLREGELT